MTKMILCMLTVVLTACSGVSSQSINQATGANNNPSNIKPVPSATLSDCAKNRTYGLESNINIPEELCVDSKKPIDGGEQVKTNKKLVGNTLSSEYDIPFEKLPPEVRNIVRLTTGEQFTRGKFILYVIPGEDENQPGKRSVKTYRYISDGEASWDFMRQNKLLKLSGAELKNPPTVEKSVLDKFIFDCSSRGAKAAAPTTLPLPKIPLELCIDDKKPLDRSEYADTIDDNGILREQKNIAFDQLPPEVQNIIRLTSGDQYINSKFHLIISLNQNNYPVKPKKNWAKGYFYYPGKEIEDNPNWNFVRQNNTLKLDQASLAVQK